MRVQDKRDGRARMVRVTGHGSADGPHPLPLSHGARGVAMARRARAELKSILEPLRQMSPGILNYRRFQNAEVIP